MVVFPQMSPLELLSYISNKLGGTDSSRLDSMDLVLQRLETQLRTLTAQGRHPIIAIDDAQAISDRQVFQSLQLLLNFQQSNQINLTLILAGQPDLIGSLRRLPQLEDRIAIPSILQPLSLDETSRYVAHLLNVSGRIEPIFSDEALKSIHELSNGFPRRINRLCDLALLVGYAEQRHQIDAEQIEGVSLELSLSRAA